MKAQTMFMSWVGTQAVPNRQSSSCSSLRTRALRWSCRRQNEINRTAYQLRVCVGDQHFEKEIEEMKESTFKGVGGLNIFTRSWQPEGKTRGVIVIVPGFNSHSGQYLWVGEQFAAKDLAAYAIDLRGRGRSEGERYYVEKMEDYTDDVATLVRTAKSENPGLPVFVLGHSAGVVDSMTNDPLIKGESEPTQTAKVMIDAATRLHREFPLIKLPVLMLHGTEDKATNPSGSQFFYDNAGSTDKTLKLYEGHYHDLLNDVDKDVVMADINDWIDARVPVTRTKSVAR